MLDTHGRKIIDPFINRIARFLLGLGLIPNHITILGLIVGLGAAMLVYMGHPLLSVILLWLSGLLDVVDGAMARLGGMASSWGSLLDLLFDRIVESALVLSIGLRAVNMLPQLLLMIVILFSMTIFLSVGALCDKKSIKSFYYQAGLAERTEGFIMFTLIIMFPRYATFFTLVFIAIIGITIIQRLAQAKKLLQ